MSKIYEKPTLVPVAYDLQEVLCQSDYSKKFHDTGSGTADVSFSWDDDSEFE